MGEAGRAIQNRAWAVGEGMGKMERRRARGFQGPVVALWTLAAVGMAVAAPVWVAPAAAERAAAATVDLGAMDENGDGRIDAREWKRGMAPHWAARGPQHTGLSDAAPRGVTVVGPDGQERVLVPKARLGAGAPTNSLAAMAAQREQRQRTSVLEARERARARGIPVLELPDFADLDPNGDGVIDTSEARRAAAERGWPMP